MDWDDPDVDRFPVVLSWSSTRLDVMLCCPRSTYVLNISAFTRIPEDLCTYFLLRLYASGLNNSVPSQQIVSTSFISTVVKVCS